MENYFYCIDIGGTAIKGGIVSENNEILFQDKVLTNPTENPDYLSERIFSLIDNLGAKSNLSINNSKGLGIGSPGMVDSDEGIIKFSGNLKLKNYNLLKSLQKKISVPIKIANDADLATLAEQYVGAGKGYKNFVMLTIGTGIGSGIVINGKLLGLSSPYSGEIGHMKTSDSGIKCSCGETNCFEALASTKALIRMTREEMQQNPNSAMWSKYNLSSVTGKTIFEFLKTDSSAKKVFKQYIKNLGNGIVSIYNIFMPDAIIIGGAISNQKDVLLDPLKKYTDSHIYAKNIDYKTNILIASATGDAGILGAKFLF